MKRILALLLAAITLLSLASCSSGLATEETETKTEEKKQTKVYKRPAFQG